MAKRKRTDLIVGHCTASRGNLTVASLRNMHKARGFKDIGYNIWTKGRKLMRGRGWDEIGAHVAGYNSVSFGFAWDGGWDGSGPSEEDKQGMLKIMREAVKRYPGAKITGHRYLSPDGDRDGVVEPHEWTKTCPNFNIETFAHAHGLPAANFSGHLNGKKDPLPEAPDKRTMWLQKLLRMTGANIVADGWDGPKTSAAIRQFEEDHGLPVTGSFDTRATVDLLKKVAVQQSPEPVKAVVQDAAANGRVSTTTIAAAVSGAGGIAATGNEIARTVTEAKTSFDMIMNAGPWVLLAVVCAGAAYWIYKERQRKIAQAREALQ